MIDHTGIGVVDLARSAAFYDGALGALGLRRAAEIDGGVGYGIDHPVFWIDRFHPAGQRHHTAFRARSRAEVGAFHAAACATGGTCNGPPGLRGEGWGYPSGYYAAFVLDPDGNNVEAVFRGPWEQDGAHGEEGRMNEEPVVREERIAAETRDEGAAASLALFAHPFSSYCQKVLIALYENGTPFAYRMLDQDHPENGAELARLWPPAKFPLLLDGDRPVVESSTIIEHLQIHHPGLVRLIPDDPAAALEVRTLDRVFDNHVMANMQRVVNDALRAPERRDPVGVEQAKSALEKAYGWLDERMTGRGWAAGGFSLADCAAAPSLFYADWVHPIAERFPALRAYRARLLARPSFARAVDEARPYRPFFPLGAPDRD